MKPLILLILLSFSTSCGVDPDIRDTIGAITPHNRTIDPKLKSYYNDFVKLCKKYENKKCLELRKNIREIVFKPENDIQDRADSTTVGLCIVYERGPYFGQRSIWIDETLPENIVKLVMYHELGHCLLDLDHETHPNLIMSAELSIIPLFQWAMQIHRLFTGE